MFKVQDQINKEARIIALKPRHYQDNVGKNAVHDDDEKVLKDNSPLIVGLLGNIF